MSWLGELLGEEQLARLAAERSAARGLPMPAAIFDFDDVAEAIRVVEDAINKRSDVAREQGKRRIRDAAQNPGTCFLEARPFSAMGSELWRTDVVLPTILRRSLLVTVCSHVEFVLKRWCAGLHDHWKLASKPQKPVQETASHYYMRYLSEVGGLQLADFEEWSEWQMFETYWAARNALVHNAGSIDEQSEKADRIRLLRFVQIDDSKLLLPDRAVVHVLPGACEEVAALAATLFDKIGQAYLAASEQRGVQP